MNVLKVAAHQSGLKFSLYWVVMPLVFAMLVPLFCMLIWKYEWLIIPLGCLILAVPLGGIIAYFFARKNPKLIREELESMIRTEEILQPMYRETVDYLSQALSELDQDRRASMERLWAEMTLQKKEMSIRRKEELLGALRQELARANPKVQLKHPEVFLNTHQVIRDGEAALDRLRDLEIGPLPEKVYEEIVRSAQESFEASKKSSEAYLATYRKKISLSERTIAEAQQALQSLA